MTPFFYFDHHSTTPIDEEVWEAMIPYCQQRFGNAASREHSFGWQAEAGVNEAKKSVSRFLNCDAQEIIFTSGATESNNLAILGFFPPNCPPGHMVSQVTEHPAVLDVVHEVERRGHAITFVGVDKFGRVDPEVIGSAIRPETRLVSIMSANNEIGTLQPLPAIGEVCKAAGVPFHTDAAQAGAYQNLDVEALGVDLLSLSAHKMYGPKGIGGLYIRRRRPRLRLSPLIFGGGQQRGLRSGTVFVAGAVGLGKAADIALRDRVSRVEHVRQVRDHVEDELKRSVSEIQIFGDPVHRHPGNLHIRLPGCRADAVLKACRDMAFASGSACASAKDEPSHVMRAIGLTSEEAAETLRFGFGKGNSLDDAQKLAERLTRGVKEGHFST
jgi:cysteine desulfurase